MKHKNLLATLALCALIQTPLCLGSEAQQAQQSFLQRYASSPLRNLSSAMSQKAASAYTTSRDYAASLVPQSIKDTVNSWSTKKKMAVATAILGALAAIYNRDVLMQWSQNIIDPLLSPEQLAALKLPTDIANLSTDQATTLANIVNLPEFNILNLKPRQSSLSPEQKNELHALWENYKEDVRKTMIADLQGKDVLWAKNQLEQWTNGLSKTNEGTTMHETLSVLIQELNNFIKNKELWWWKK